MLSTWDHKKDNIDSIGIGRIYNLLCAIRQHKIYVYDVFWVFLPSSSLFRYHIQLEEMKDWKPFHIIIMTSKAESGVEVWEIILFL